MYNAENYINQAVQSALDQDQVAEVILVEDGSTDSSLYVCKSLLANTKVKLCQHSMGKNRGAGESRNLGIVNSGFDYIAFLDADDYYLSNRFVREEEIFSTKLDVDGVYSATGISFESEEERKKWTDIRQEKLVTTVLKPVFGSAFFRGLLLGGIGRFTTNGICVRKRIFNRTGFFADLPIAQDTNMWLKMALVGNLVPGEITLPTSIRRVHKNNRSVTTAEERKPYWIKNLEELFFWAVFKTKSDYDTLNLIFIVLYGTWNGKPELLFLNMLNIKSKLSLMFTRFYFRKTVQVTLAILKDV